MPTATDRRANERRSAPNFSPAERQSLRRQLLRWYQGHARDLPWRRTRDPYHVWVSEIMLQQTQVATVRDYFTRFIAALPDVRRLAAADEQQVLRLWEGLGYYRRARQMHAAAKMIVTEFGGRFPDCEQELTTLPGIGRYTAGAIASIAFNRRAAILEANTVRLLSRLIAYRDNPLRSAGQRVLWAVAEEILPHANVAQFNQALMELGSLLCTPSEPKCGQCPLSSVCAAKAAGLQQQIPPAKLPKEYTELHEAAVIVRKQGRVLMRLCAAEERWAGLWDFPRFAVESGGPLFQSDEVITKVADQTGIECRAATLVTTLRHGVTRYRITLECYRAEFSGGRIRCTSNSPIRWVTAAQLSSLPLSTTGRKIARLAFPAPEHAPPELSSTP